jgi:hypothetical protein
VFRRILLAVLVPIGVALLVAIAVVLVYRKFKGRIWFAPVQTHEQDAEPLKGYDEYVHALTYMLESPYLHAYMSDDNMHSTAILQDGDDEVIEIGISPLEFDASSRSQRQAV